MVQIFWAISAGFLGGVFSASFFTSFFLVLCIVAIACAVLLVPRGFLFGIFLCACALGMGRMYIVDIPRSTSLDASVGKEISIEGVVFEEPDIREHSTRLSVEIFGGVRMLVIAPLHVDVSYGDRVRATGVVRIPENFDTGLGHSFKYSAFLAKDGIAYEMSFANIERVGIGDWNWFKGFAIYIKQKYLEGLSRALPEPHAGLAGGITAGDKRGIGSELSDIFRTVGLIHIVVLSGYNIMVVIGFIERMFSRAHYSARLMSGIGVAILFALMTGLASSSVRAAAMATLATVGKITGRTYLAARALMFVTLGMVLWNPYILIFDPGFQLSVIATWGILFISPHIETFLTFVTERFSLREIAATTIGTQLAVLPLLLYQSGTLSLVALPANLLVLAAVPYAMLASFIAGIAGLVTGPLAPFIAFPAYVLLSYILVVAEWAARVPFSSIMLPAFSGALLVVLYALLVTLVQSMRNDSQSQTN